MKPVFADTSFCLAMISEQDAAHGAAVRWSASARRTILTTDYVLLELGNALSARRVRRLFTAALDTIRGDPSTRVVAGSRMILDGGLRLFRSRPDKDWSLTDCVSFFVMHRHGLRQALSTDRHFSQAGFQNVLQ